MVDVRVREHEPPHRPPEPATAAANGSHCERTMSVSMTVMPSSSTITPALLTPDSPPGWIHTNTPSASSCSVSRRRFGFGFSAGSESARRERTGTFAAMSERSRNLPRRSCLSVPGSSEKMLGKAPGLGADMVFLDLEDAVAPLEKPAARGKVVNAINDARLGRDASCACA